MKILLFGEYSNLHNHLAAALRRAGHRVTLVSDGDSWKDYHRDIDLRRRYKGKLGSADYLRQLVALLPRLRGYDVVQLVNPIFLDLKPRWNRRVFDYLRRHNRVVSLGLFGDDHTIIGRSLDDTYLEYTDLFACGRFIDHPRNRYRRELWNRPDRRELCRHLTARADCLVACLYEYYHLYDTPEFRDRLHYAPLPIDLSEPDGDGRPSRTFSPDRPVNILIGIQRERGVLKGTDRMLPWFEQLATAHPDRIRLTTVENVPFAEYQQLLAATDVLVDQLYSFTPAMNALEAMKFGTIVVSGGEEAAYRFVGEHDLRPIINLRPGQERDNLSLLEATLLDPDRLTAMSEASRLFVRRHHDADLVAQRYLQIWTEAR